VRPVPGADNLTADCLDNVGSLTSRNPVGLHDLLLGWLYLFFIMEITNNLKTKHKGQKGESTTPNKGTSLHAKQTQRYEDAFQMCLLRFMTSNVWKA
jgi:hypothetical protein